MQLYQKYRPTAFADVVGQDAVLASLDRLRQRGGLAGRTYWLAGQSGTGKTTIARLIAAEVAEGWATTEYASARQLSVADLDEIGRSYRYRPLGKGECIIVNEAHGLRQDQIERLLGLTENAPQWVTWVFTTTHEGQRHLFDDKLDGCPFGSRTVPLVLRSSDLELSFAVRAREIARAEGLDGDEIEHYLALARQHRCNLRAMLIAIEAA